MVSREDGNWIFDYEGLIEEIPAPDGNFCNPSAGFNWPIQALNGSSNVSVEIDGALAVSEAPKENGSKKRGRTESCTPSSSKACREKLRRDRLNDKFMELGCLLEPGRTPKTDKAAILIDAMKMVIQLRAEAQKLKESNSSLQENIKELKAEKIELRDEKQRLKTEKEKLENELKSTNTHPGFLPPHQAAMAAAFAPQHPSPGGKLVPVVSYPGVAMWQFMPPAQVDTSQDHALRPPVAYVGFMCFHISTINAFTARTSSSPKPPSSKQEAILQAKTSLATTLQKPINNPRQFTGKMKKQKQPRFRAEIPVIDDSPESITQLAFDVFGAMPIKRKGSSVKLLLVWPNSSLKESGIRAFKKSSSEHIDLTTYMTTDNRILNSADVAVFLAPEASQVTAMKALSDSFDQKPVVLFNPRWSFDEESEFGGLQDFLRSFDVVYAFLGLEVKGLLSKRQGVVFRCVKDGVSNGEMWNVLVEEEEGGGDLKVITKFKSRPSIVEVENVLYNLMAVNSPITKSAKFLRDLVSNVTGKK
ncbi:hypothetical protein V2J09_017412 [Rumex salicifolius]